MKRVINYDILLGKIHYPKSIRVMFVTNCMSVAMNLVVLVVVLVVLVGVLVVEERRTTTKL